MFVYGSFLNIQYMHTFGVSKTIYVFEKGLLHSTRLNLFKPIYSKNMYTCNIMPTPQTIYRINHILQ